MPPRRAPVPRRRVLPRRPGPLPQNGIYNLQVYDANNAEVGEIIVLSNDRWLFADEVAQILARADGIVLRVSNGAPPRGSIGLFIVHTERFIDHWQWEHVGDALAVRRPVVENGERINRSESTGFLNANYRRRVHWRTADFGDRVLVHYRMLQ